MTPPVLLPAELSIATHLPWLLSALTVYMTILAGNKNRMAWAFGLLGQALWLLWIVSVQAWGLLPMNAALWIVYGRNHLRWRRQGWRHFS